MGLMMLISAPVSTRKDTFILIFSRTNDTIASTYGRPVVSPNRPTITSLPVTVSSFWVLYRYKRIMVLSRGRLRASTCWRISGKLSAADSTRPSSTATHCLGYSSISRDVVSERNCAEWVNAINSAHTSAGSPRLSKGLRSCSIFPPHDYWLSRCVPQRRVAACLAIWWRSTVVGALALALPPVPTAGLLGGVHVLFIGLAGRQARNM